MTDTSPIQQKNNANPVTENQFVFDPSYVDPNKIVANKDTLPINHLPNKKFTIILIAIFLITSMVALIITNNNTRKYRESLKPKQYLLPTPSS